MVPLPELFERERTVGDGDGTMSEGIAREEVVACSSAGRGEYG